MKPKAPEEGCGPVIACACGCGKTMKMYDDRKRPRSYLPGHHVIAAWQAVKREVLQRAK